MKSTTMTTTTTKRKVYQDDSLRKIIRFGTAELLAHAQRRAKEEGMTLTGYVNNLVRRDKGKRW